jgi:hypothetical protein
MTETVPPVFKFDGDGYLEFFQVFEIHPDNVNKPLSEMDLSKDRLLWRIFPRSSKSGSLPIRDFQYGIIPPGFKQVLPQDGPPPPLEEGKVYKAGGPPVQVGWDEGFFRFTIKDGRCVRLPTPKSY